MSPAGDRQTDGQTDKQTSDHNMYSASMASFGVAHFRLELKTRYVEQFREC